MRKLTILFAALTLSVGLWAETPAVGDTIIDDNSGVYFAVTAVGETNTVKVIKNNYTATSYTVPDTVKYLDVDFAVTEIGTRAFDNCESLQSITIPDGVISLGTGAFYECTGLTSVTFLGNACQDAIGGHAFDGVGDPDPALLTLPDNWTGSKPDEDGNWYGGTFVMSSTPTALPTVKNAVKATKVMTNGQVIFRKENKNFSVLGQEIR